MKKEQADENVARAVVDAGYEPEQRRSGFSKKVAT
jgi:hypothetical protein